MVEWVVKIKVVSIFHYFIVILAIVILFYSPLLWLASLRFCSGCSPDLGISVVYVVM